MHLVDVTLFYGNETGGVHTYLTAKHDWLTRRARVRHTLVLPMANGYRLPVGAVSRILHGLEPDLIEVGDPFHLAWSALAAGKELNVPVIGFYHCDLPHRLATRFGARAQRLASAYISQLYSRFDLVIAPSRVMVQRLEELGVEPVMHQPLGVDTEVFHPHRRDGTLRAHLNLPPDARLLIYVGRFAREKNLPVLIEAATRLGPAYHVVLVGSGDRLPYCANMTHLAFENDRGKLARLIASCDVFVHPGDQESFGLVVLEAMACAVPVVGANAGGVAELIDADTGVLVAPNSPRQLAEGIDSLFGRDLATLGSSARRKVERHYAWDTVMQRLFGCYRGLCAGTARAEASIPPEVGVAD
jgi:alpha-1,6-mannosyltransferase